MTEVFNQNDSSFVKVYSFSLEGKTYLVNNKGGIIEHVPSTKTEGSVKNVTQQYQFILNGRIQYTKCDRVSWWEIVYLSYPKICASLDELNNPKRFYDDFRVTYNGDRTLKPHQHVYLPTDEHLVINCTNAHPVEYCNCPECVARKE